MRARRSSAERLGAGEDTARAYVHLGELLRLRGAHAAALEAMLTGERIAARLGMRGTFGHFMYVNAADDLVHLGRWDEAEQRLEEAERMELGTTAGAMHHAIAGHLHALRGEPTLARAHLERATELADEGLPGEFVTPITAQWAALALTEGDPETARRHVDAALAAEGDDRTRSTRRRCTRSACGRKPTSPSALAGGGARTMPRRPPRAPALLADLGRLLSRSAAVPGGLAHRATANAEQAG